MNYAVIMAGGYGERFWPLSRKKRPKQCIPINSDKPMIKETVDRLRPLFKDNIYISTGINLANEIRKTLPNSKFILEPMARNTAACIGLSAITLLKEDKEAIMFLETSDHINNDENLYLKNIDLALKTAKESDHIVLMGIKPSQPHTGYGYIEISNNYKGIIDHVNCFKEKPDLKTAKEYIKSGKFFWNSGMFISKCSVMLNEIKEHMPKLYSSLIKIQESDFDKEVLRKEFEGLDKISIDYGVMEKSNKTLVLKADMHWDDIGDLKAFERFTKEDENGNVVKGNLIELDSKNNIIISGKEKLVSLIGIKDTIITVTDDVILVADKRRAQDVKSIVNKLSKNNKKYIE